MPVHLTRTPALAIPLLLAACTSAPDPAIELGSGELEWLPLSDGDDLEVIYGPQGGYHFLGSVRIHGFDPGDHRDVAADNNPTTRFEAEVDGKDLVIIEPFTQGYEPAPTSAEPYTHQIIGRFVIIGIDNDDDINGKDVRFFVEVEDHLGSTWTDERTLVVVPNIYNDDD